MRKLLEYEDTGEWQDQNVSYENSVVVRQDEGFEILFRSVIRDNEDGMALYSQSLCGEIDEHQYRHWINSLDISSYNFGEIKHESNLGPDRDHKDIEDIMPSETEVTYSRLASHKRESRLWIREGEASKDEVDIKWDGVRPGDVYEDIIGRSTVRDTDLRTEKDWEEALPGNFVRDLPQKSYDLYRNIAIEDIAAKQGVPPVEVFEEFYEGETEGNEYVVISGKNQDITLANPWGERLRDALDGVELESVQHLYSGGIDRYTSKDLDKLTDRFSSTDNVGPSAKRELPESIFGVLGAMFNIKSVNGAVIESEDQDRMQMMLNGEVKMVE